MSANVTFRNGLIAAIGISGLTLSACASSHGDRYDVSAFESGSNSCGVSGAAAPSTRYSSGCSFETAPAPAYTDCGPVAQPSAGCAPAYVAPAPAPAPVYADCGQIAAMDCGAPVTMHSEPMPYTGSTTYSGGSVSMGSTEAQCPAGTSLQSDGTCMQGSGYISSSSVGMGSTSSMSYGGSTISSSSSVSCPAGTTMQADNTCLQSGSSSSYTGGYSHSSSSSVTTSTAPVNCPSGTVMQGDGTCMASSGGYSSSSTYTATDYLPIRK